MLLKMLMPLRKFRENRQERLKRKLKKMAKRNQKKRERGRKRFKKKHPDFPRYDDIYFEAMRVMDNDTDY